MTMQFIAVGGEMLKHDKKKSERREHQCEEHKGVWKTKGPEQSRKPQKGFRGAKCSISKKLKKRGKEINRKKEACCKKTQKVTGGGVGNGSGYQLYGTKRKGGKDYKT